MRFLFMILAMFCLSCSHTYYIVRHAEKAEATANTGSDVPLNDIGKERAKAIMEIMANKKIAYVFSTNTIRTKSTAQPIADHFHLSIETYGPRPDSAFISLLKTKKKNTLIVGHSNTIDDVVNMLCNKKEIDGDLPETEYNKLFIVKKKGKKFLFTESKIYP